jgi:hypothetical protein
MKRFVVERILPDAGNLFPGELQAIDKTFCSIIKLTTGYKLLLPIIKSIVFTLQKTKLSFGKIQC